MPRYPNWLRGVLISSRRHQDGLRAASAAVLSSGNLSRSNPTFCLNFAGTVILMRTGILSLSPNIAVISDIYFDSPQMSVAFAFNPGKRLFAAFSGYEQLASKGLVKLVDRS